MKTQKIRLVQPAEEVPVLTIRFDDLLRTTGWSKPTGYRHLPHLKKYHVRLPGETRGTLLIDYADLKTYLQRFEVAAK